MTRAGTSHRPRPSSRVMLSVASLTLVVLLVLSGAAGALLREAQARLRTPIGAPPQAHPPEPIDPADPPSLRLAVLGDVGTGDEKLLATAAAVGRLGEERPYEAVVLLGDNVYPSGDPERLDETVFGPLGPVLDRGAELLAVLGNHDVEQDHGDPQAAALGMPARWYSRRLGPVEFFALDSTQVDDPAQLRWLEGALAASTATFRIAALHHPPYSAGRHSSDLAVRRTFVPVFERHRVDVVLAGHDHDYQRSNPVNGVTYIVTGAAARVRSTGREDFTAVSWATHHFVDVLVRADSVELRAVDQEGRVFDDVTLAARP